MAPEYALGRVEGVEVYRNDAVVVREGRKPTMLEHVPRGKITEFSYQSRQRLAFVALNTEVDFHTMICLTYPKEFPTDGLKVKEDLHRFLGWLRRDTGRCSYLWFLEFQKRGAPHIHIMIDVQFPRDKPEALKAFRFRVSATWYRHVGSEDYKHLQAGTNVQRIRKKDGARFYCVKYASKMNQKRVPEAYQNVGRLWGASRNVKPEPLGYIRATEDDIRETIREWEHKPSDTRPIYRVLYNQASRFRDRLD